MTNTIEHMLTEQAQDNWAVAGLYYGRYGANAVNVAEAEAAQASKSGDSQLASILTDTARYIRLYNQKWAGGRVKV